jgi:glycosyltransferase involved in cell wall biosynthesis
MTTLSVVIPAYNEEDGIDRVARRVLAIRNELMKVGIDDLELLIVDDGSADDTVQIVNAIEGVRLIQHEENKGYGAALKTGFAQARGELIGFLDADGTYPPEYFPNLCREALNGTDLVIGSRMAGADSQMPLTRKAGNLFFATLLSLLAHMRVSDSASGMRVFRRDVLERVYPLPDGLNLTPVMSTRALHEGIRVAEVPIPYSERHGRSKLSVVRDGSIFLRSMIWTALTYNPVRILGAIGAVLMVLALVTGLGLVTARLQGSTTLSAWQVASLFGGVLAGVSGISIYALGITFNYLVSLFYKQPVRQGLFGRPILPFPLDRHFWWIGGALLIIGFATGIASLWLGIGGWDIERLWLYLLGSALFSIVGVQLIVFWIILRVLDELSQRERLIAQDLLAEEKTGSTTQEIHSHVRPSYT